MQSNIVQADINQAKFKVGDKVVVVFKKQRGEVTEVLDCTNWSIPTIRYKIKTDLNTVTVDEHYVDAQKT